MYCKNAEKKPAKTQSFACTAARRWRVGAMLNRELWAPCHTALVHLQIIRRDKGCSSAKKQTIINAGFKGSPQEIARSVGIGQHFS